MSIWGKPSAPSFPTMAGVTNESWCSTLRCAEQNQTDSESTVPSRKPLPQIPADVKELDRMGWCLELLWALVWPESESALLPKQNRHPGRGLEPVVSGPREGSNYL